MGNWKDEAYRLYFDEKRKINEISLILGKSRQSVSAFLNSKDIEAEKKRRKKESRQRQKKSNRDNMKRVRKKSNAALESALIKRQHIVDVGVLSRERFFDEY